MYKLKKLSKYRQLIEPTGSQKVPIEFGVPEELLPDNKTIEQLIEVASNEHIFHHLAALTDIHQKPGRKNPSGSVVSTKRYFLPQLIDTAPNCGMRLIKTPFGDGDLNEEKIDEIFKELVEWIPTKTLVGSFFSNKNIVDISMNGVAPLLKVLKEDPDQLKGIMNGGNMFQDEKITKKQLFEAIPSIFFKFAQFRLGVLGAAGNHFLDLMKIDEILDEQVAKEFEIKKGQYIFLMHTGSGLMGQYASYFYTPKQKEHFSQKAVLGLARFFYLNDKKDWHRILEKEIPKFKNKKDFFAIDSQSKLGENYYLAHRAAANHGFANRTVLQNNIKKALKKVLGKDIKLETLYDMSHVFASKEHHFEKDVIVHRNNASRAFGPKRMKDSINPTFARTGEPVFMPSSMSTPAYIGVATDENESTFFSAAHGTGKSKEKTSKIPKDKEELFNKMKERKIKLYNASSKEIINQDAGHYKDPEIAIESVKKNKIMKPIAKMSPVAVLMA